MVISPTLLSVPMPTPWLSLGGPSTSLGGADGMIGAVEMTARVKRFEH